MPSNVTWAKILQESIDKYPKEKTASIASVASLNPLKLNNRCVIPRKIYYPKTSSQPVLISTTDARASKTSHFLNVSPATSLVWWFPTPNTQFRLNGTCRIVQAGEKDSEWEDVRVGLWKEMSPFMRGTFGRKPEGGPGSHMDSYEQGKDWPTKLGAEPEEEDNSKERDLIAYARDNFALLVIEPTLVDFAELGVIPNQRTVYTLNEKSDEWDSEIQCP
ncbi:Pyridoxamine 5'-phosphate oxidase, Alr4036 family, FMN-binding domain [Phaffia rhodozyma]|uniref:Pyridoxamine 5'-phosphate oxidase, Alr4036 family, FMN-binding domain n=1 Tax=Phaffia rhodozyma TaxID=264483 RepID=A0A0F7SWM1_PHARH|nr:Pyridoxamine 5'-phosphate oxidase, Alr4036 family, FMN-binding domain [Phaffia rhodozyma]